MKKQGKSKGAINAFKTYHKDTTNSITTKIQAYIPNGLKSFTIDLGSHWVYTGTDSGLDALKALDKLLGRKVGTYVTNSLWDFIIIDMDYPDTAFNSGSSFVQIQITAARRVQVTDYDAVAQPLLDLRDYVVGLIGDEFEFSDKKIKRKVNFS